MKFSVFTSVCGITSSVCHKGFRYEASMNKTRVGLLVALALGILPATALAQVKVGAKGKASASAEGGAKAEGDAKAEGEAKPEGDQPPAEGDAAGTEGATGDATKGGDE